MCTFLGWCFLSVLSAFVLFVTYIFADSKCLHGRPGLNLDQWLFWSVILFWCVVLFLSMYRSLTGKAVMQAKVVISFVIGCYATVMTIIGAVVINKDQGCKGVTFVDNLESVVAVDGVHFVLVHTETSLDDEAVYYYNLWFVALASLLLHAVMAVVAVLTFVGLVLTRTDEAMKDLKRSEKQQVIIVEQGGGRTPSGKKGKHVSYFLKK